VRQRTVREAVDGFDHKLSTGAQRGGTDAPRSAWRRTILIVLGGTVALAAGARFGIRDALQPRAYAQSAPDNNGGAKSEHPGEATTFRTVATTAPPATARARNESSMDQAAKTQGDSPFGAFENSGSRGPVAIRSDSLALDYKNNSVMFRGKVHAAQADGQLTSNTLNVKYGKDFHEIQEMIADGDVHISQGVRWCSADHGVMNQMHHTVVLTGSPICHDANDQISGTRITVHTDSGRSEIEGGVKAVIFPHPSKTRDNGASDNQH
jgi:lipopolysaccharide transport protein LptA